MQKSRGFTLIELLVVISVAAGLMALAAPSFSNLIRSSAMSSGVNSFMADLRFARSESIRRGGWVTMCRSNDPESATPACNGGAGTSGNGWVSGWIVFLDQDHNNDYTAGEPILRVQGPIKNVNSIVETNTSPQYWFMFSGVGRLPLGGSTSLQFGSTPKFSSSDQRMVCVNVGGRARIAGDGTVSCS
jgi:type IV fimbrial biogenesis protein FimT